jgi:hypothetical protein
MHNDMLNGPLAGRVGFSTVRRLMVTPRIPIRALL